MKWRPQRRDRFRCLSSPDFRVRQMADFGHFRIVDQLSKQSDELFICHFVCNLIFTQNHFVRWKVKSSAVLTLAAVFFAKARLRLDFIKRNESTQLIEWQARAQLPL